MLSNVFKRKKREPALDLVAVFSTSQFAEIEFYSNSFPLPICMLTEGICAYKLVFLVDDSSFARLELLLESCGFNRQVVAVDGGVRSSKSDCSLVMKVTSEFGGKLIRMITNDTLLLESVVDLKLSPPRPEVSFPDLEADAVGSLQGELGFWWFGLWKPYWGSLSYEERSQLRLSEEWVEFIEWH